MAETKQPIEGGSLLSSIAELFFKGLDKALSSAAEYEEEMGVLKQVNHIPIVKDGKKYDLKVTLAPIKNKDSFYYVEAKTDAPDFDVSSINGKPMNISNKNIKKFREIVEKLITDNGYTTDVFDDLGEIEDDEAVDKADNAQSNDEEEQSSNVSQSSEGTELDEDVANLINKLISMYKNQSKMTVGQVRNAEGRVLEPGQTIVISIENIIVPNNDAADAQMALSAINVTLGGQPYGEVKEYPLSLKNDGELRSIDELRVDVENNIRQFAKYLAEEVAEEATATGTLLIMASIQLEASFILEDGEVALTAINASTDIKAAIDIIYDLAENEEFLNTLSEEDAKAFRILDETDGYDIEEIESVDTSNTYKDLFKAAYTLNQTILAYRWALGREASNSTVLFDSITWPANDALDCFAEWVIRHDSCYPYGATFPQGQGEFSSFDELKDGDSISPEKVKAAAIASVEDFVDILNAYYANLEHSEQSKVDDLIESFEHILTYA